LIKRPRGISALAKRKRADSVESPVLESDYGGPSSRDVPSPTKRLKEVVALEGRRVSSLSGKKLSVGSSSGARAKGKGRSSRQ